MKSQDFPETGFLKHKVVFLEEIIPKRFGVSYGQSRLYDLLSRLEG
jgi:transposase